MKFKCENCGLVFDVDVMDWRELKDVKCPNCGSSCVVRISRPAVVY